MGKVVINKFVTLPTMRKVGGQKEFSLYVFTQDKNETG